MASELEVGGITATGNVGVGGAAVGKLSVIGTTATTQGSHITFTNTQGAKVFAVGGGKSGVSNNGFCVVNVTDDTAPLTISDAGLVKVSKGHTGTFTALSLGNTSTSANDNVSLELQAAGLGAPARIEAEAPGGSDTDLAFYTVNGGSAGLAMRLDADGPATFSAGIEVTNSNNYGVVEGNASTLEIADDSQVQVADTIAGAMLLHVYETNDGYGGLIFATYYGAPVVLADPANVFSNADTDGKICVYKSTTSHDVFLKNRLGGTRYFRMLITAGNVDL